MDNKLTNFPSTTEYPESDKEQFVDEKFSASDYEISGTDNFSNEPIYSLKNELKKIQKMLSRIMKLILFLKMHS